MSFHDRKHERYDLAHPDAVAAMVSDRDDLGGDATEVRLDNISTGGAQFTAPCRMRKNALVRISLRTQDGLTLGMNAIVRWAIVDSQGWVCGCQFEDELESEVLSQLAESGVLDRRRNQRIPVLLECSAVFAGNPEKVNCRITDYSNGGVCLKSDVLVPLGYKVRVAVSDAGEKAEVYGVVQWVDEQQKLMGIEFLREKDKEAFLNCVEVIA